METRLVNPHACQYVQSRIVLDPVTVADYAEMFRNEIDFEPCQAVITPAGDIIIYDGNHRAAAAKRTAAMLEVALTPGTAGDAEWLAAGANTRHGLRRSAEDIAQAVTIALRHAHAQGKSDREIARHCGCDHKTVGKYRKALEASGELPQIDTRTVQRNGAAYQMTIPMPAPPAAEPEPAWPRLLTRYVCGGCQQETAYDDLTEQNGLALCKECMKKVETPIETWQPGDALHIGRWRVMPNLDIEIGQDNELFAHSNYGRRFLREATHIEKAKLINAMKPEADKPQADTAAIENNETQALICTGCGTKIEGGYEEYLDGAPFHPMCHYRAKIEMVDDLQEQADRVEIAFEKLQKATTKASAFPAKQAQAQGTPLIKLDWGVTLAWKLLSEQELQQIITLATHELTGREAQGEAAPVFGSSFRDRMKLLEAGLRVFRVDEHTCTLKEFKRGKTTSYEGDAPSGLGSWQKFEQLPTKAAVKRRIQELDQDAQIVFESRI
jgi:hypothetical protein